MKKNMTLVAAVLAALVAAGAQAYPTMTEKSSVPNYSELKTHMDKMILSAADMDIMVNKNRELDYDILGDDARMILDAVAKIRGIDKGKAFAPHLRHLEAAAKKLQRAAVKRDPKAGDYANRVFETCFSCHAEFRKW